MRGNRDIHRKPMDMGFVRKADGTLRPADQGRDIKDIWADVNRIKLREAIEKDQKKKTRRERRRGLFGAVKTSEKPNDANDSAKTVEIKINFPEISIGGFFRGIASRLRNLPLRRKHYGAMAGILLFVVLFAASFSLYGNSSKDKAGKKDVAGVQISEVPSFSTVLPIDKTVEDLGGWKRVSPKDKEPVYAFNDEIDGVQITVSEQPLPEAFKDDTDTHIAKLAKDFAANEKITAGLSYAYVGTSVKGPQSVILTKNEVLILIQSASKLSNAQWEGYIATLQ